MWGEAGRSVVRGNLPTSEAMHSSPGIASLWLHLRLSNDFARSTAGWCDLPRIYNSWMQHCVITDDEGSFLYPPRVWRGLHSLSFTVPTSTCSIRAKRSIFCDTAVSHMSESTNRESSDGYVSQKGLNFYFFGDRNEPRTWYGCLKPNEVEYMAISLRYAFERN
jgi:hypothetical protein